MYRHLLVPLDDSPLRSTPSARPSRSRKTLGAKVTFFHAQADYGASSVGALERVMSPAAFNEHMAGEARAILAKAEVVARVAGVPHDSAIMTSDRPHEAILDAAEARGCDLIFIASHGHRGIKGLDARLADAEGAPADDDSGAGGGGREQLAVRGDARAAHDDPRRAPLDRRGHPWARIRRPRKRATGNAAVVSAAARDAPLPRGVSGERCIIRRKTRTCSASCASARASSTRRSTSSSASTSSGHAARRRAGAEHRRLRGGSRERPDRASRRRSSGSRQRRSQHMALEAEGHHPAARRHLTDEDWAEIGAAFAANGDPRFSVDNDEEFRELFVRILNLAQAPVVRRTGAARSKHTVQFNNVHIRETQDHATPIDSKLRAPQHIDAARWRSP